MHDPADMDDDALAELLADRVVDLASRPGILRLHAMQMAGLIKPGKSSERDVAAALGLSRRKLQRVATVAIGKLQRQIPDHLKT